MEQEKKLTVSSVVPNKSSSNDSIFPEKVKNNTLKPQKISTNDKYMNES